MKISLIMPFAKRFDQLDILLCSIVKTVHTKSDIEILFAIDKEEGIYDKLSCICERYSLQHQILETSRSDYFIREYWNPIANMAKGRFIMAINDDSEFMTPDWDKIIYERLDEASKIVGDDILYGQTKDGQDNYYSFWCLQSKKTVELLGYFYYPKCIIWGPDQIAGLMYYKLSQITRKRRIIDLKDVFIRHNSCHMDASKNRENFERFERIEKTIGNYELKDKDVTDEAERLAKLI